MSVSKSTSFNDPTMGAVDAHHGVRPTKALSHPKATTVALKAGEKLAMRGAELRESASVFTASSSWHAATTSAINMSHIARRMNAE